MVPVKIPSADDLNVTVDPTFSRSFLEMYSCAVFLASAEDSFSPGCSSGRLRQTGFDRNRFQVLFIGLVCLHLHLS